MADYILSLVKVNEEINYSTIVSLIVAYLFFMWFIICLWIFFDARKRYGSIFVSVGLFLFALVFNFPALIFYIMIRPEHTLEEEYYLNLALSGEKQTKPIYFDGKHGFDIMLNLSVQPKENGNDKHKMNMAVSWVPQKKTEGRSFNIKQNHISKTGVITRKTKQTFQNLFNKIGLLLDRVNTKKSVQVNQDNNTQEKIETVNNVKKEQQIQKFIPPNPSSTESEVEKKRLKRKRKRRNRKKRKRN